MASKAAAMREFREDSWLVGNDAEFARELGARGWLGMTWPKEWGGHGRSRMERFVVFEAMISHGAPIASAWFADRQIGPTLLQFGTDEQRERYLPGLIDGTAAWSIGMSEPDAGSDVSAVRTRAVRDGDTYVVDGQKIWTSGAAARRLHLSHRPDRPRRAAPRRAVRVRRRPALPRRSTIKPIMDMTGERPLLRDLLRVRSGAGREPGRHAQRQLQTGHAPDGTRARRDRPAGVEPGALRGHAGRADRHATG